MREAERKELGCEHAFAYGDLAGQLTSEGNVGAHFRRAIDVGNLAVVRALAHELRQVPLADALAIVLLLARREPDNYPRAAARFIGRLALERPLQLVDVRDATVALLALPDAGAAELKIVCERWGVDRRPPRWLPPGPSAPRLG